MGNAGVNLRAYIYMRMLGREGMIRVAEFAALNANYLMKRLQAAGFEAAYPSRRASHEFIITLKRENREHEVTAMDVAKRLLDYGFHAPTTYFPLLVPECLLIEPTETEAQGGSGPVLRGDERDPSRNGRRIPRNCCRAHRIQCRCGAWTMCARPNSWIWLGSRPPDSRVSGPSKGNDRPTQTDAESRG